MGAADAAVDHQTQPPHARHRPRETDDTKSSSISRDAALRAGGEGDIADLLTPVSAFLKSRSIRFAFLFESVEGGSGARYSFSARTRSGAGQRAGRTIMIARGSQRQR